MRIPVLISLFALTAMGACSLFDDTEYSTREIYAREIEATEVSYHVASFLFHGQTPDPCYEQYRTEVQRVDSDVSVHVFARRDASLICACAVEDVFWNIRIGVPSAGPYRLQFWSSDSTTIDTTLIIP